MLENLPTFFHSLEECYVQLTWARETCCDDYGTLILWESEE